MKDPIPRVCALIKDDCGRQFICRGECEVVARITYFDGCWCPDCAKKIYSPIYKDKFWCESRFPKDFITSWRDSHES